MPFTEEAFGVYTICDEVFTRDKSDPSQQPPCEIWDRSRLTLWLVTLWFLKSLMVKFFAIDLFL